MDLTCIMDKAQLAYLAYEAEAALLDSDALPSAVQCVLSKTRDVCDIAIGGREARIALLQACDLATYAEAYIDAAEAEQAAWDGACAAARAADLRVDARDTVSGREGPALRAETDIAWSRLVTAAGSQKAAQLAVDAAKRSRVP